MVEAAPTDMVFIQQLSGELRKLFARPRTWMGYGAFLAMEALILTVYKLEASQERMRGMVERNGLEFSTYYSSLTITFMIMLLSMFLLGSIYFALVAGDIVAKENEDGNLRMVFARPISRFRLLLVKYTAVCLYTFSFVFFVGISGYAMAVAAVGWEGGLFVIEPKMKVFAAYPNWWEGAGRLALSDLARLRRRRRRDWRRSRRRRYVIDVLVQLDIVELLCSYCRLVVLHWRWSVVCERCLVWLGQLGAFAFAAPLCTALARHHACRRFCVVVGLSERLQPTRQRGGFATQRTACFVLARMAGPAQTQPTLGARHGDCLGELFRNRIQRQGRE